MDIVKKIKALDLPEGEYVVIGSAPMAVRGIREAGDLDIVVTPRLFRQLKAWGWEEMPWTHSGKGGKNWLKGPYAEAYIEVVRQEKENHLAEELIAEADMVDGIAFLSLERLIEFKKEYGRQKDFDDIELIEAYLEDTNPYTKRI